MKKALLATLALLTILAAPASAQRDCLRVNDIRNWWAINDRTLIVEDSWRNKFRLTLIGTCFNLRFNSNVAFQSRGATRLSCLRPGDSVINRSRGMGRSTARCAITRIERYTPEMEKSDKAAAATGGTENR
jgi:hypothetical protein